MRKKVLEKRQNNYLFIYLFIYLKYKIKYNMNN